LLILAPLQWTTELFKNGHLIWEDKVTVVLIYKREFEHLLEMAGFKRWILYGGFEYGDFESDEQDMVG